MMAFQLAAKQHALEQAPEESCGIVVNDEYYPCINISDTPEDNFAIHPKDFLKARNEVHKCIEKLDWKSGFYRKDIGFKVIDE